MKVRCSLPTNMYQVLPKVWTSDRPNAHFMGECTSWCIWACRQQTVRLSEEEVSAMLGKRLSTLLSSQSLSDVVWDTKTNWKVWKLEAGACEDKKTIAITTTEFGRNPWYRTWVCKDEAFAKDWRFITVIQVIRGISYICFKEEFRNALLYLIK